MKKEVTDKKAKAWIIKLAKILADDKNKKFGDTMLDIINHIILNNKTPKILNYISEKLGNI